MKKLYILVALVTFIAGCETDHELTKSVFKPDPDFPELPQYSEWGYNTFGAYYGRQPFISNDKEVPLVVVNHDNVTSFEFKGQLGTNTYYEEGAGFLMAIAFSDFHPETYEDLLELHQTTYDLTDPQFTVSLQGTDEVIHSVEILEGELAIKRVQTLFVDEKKQQVILSGVFNFKAVVDGEEVTISEGRFDVGVSTLNFFKY